MNLIGRQCGNGDGRYELTDDDEDIVSQRAIGELAGIISCFHSVTTVTLDRFVFHSLFDSFCDVTDCSS
jgi:hypothetical protein